MRQHNLGDTMIKQLFFNRLVYIIPHIISTGTVSADSRAVLSLFSLIPQMAFKVHCYRGIAMLIPPFNILRKSCASASVNQHNRRPAASFRHTIMRKLQLVCLYTVIPYSKKT